MLLDFDSRYIFGDAMLESCSRPALLNSRCSTPPDFTSSNREGSSLGKSGDVAHGWSEYLLPLRPTGPGVE